MVINRMGCFEAIKKVAKPKEGQLHFVKVYIDQILIIVSVLCKMVMTWM